MSNKTTRCSRAWPAFVALAVAVVPVASAQTGSAIVAEPVDLQTSVNALSYWTPEAIATTPAMPLPIDDGSSDSEQHVDGTATSTARARSVRGRMAPRDSRRFHRRQYPSDWTITDDIDYGAVYLQSNATEHFSGSNTAAGTPGIFTDYPVNEKTALWLLYPHVFTGKFTFTTPVSNSSCSATAIRNNHIVTAAHCVYGTSGNNVWYTNKVFTPAYRNGNAPFGSFPTAGCTVSSAWVNLSGSFRINSWTRHDIAVCRMGRNSAGRTLNQAVGNAGYSYNYDSKQLHFVNGYPARDISDRLLSGPAQYLRSCTAESFLQSTDVLGSGCNYGRGISGGSWLRNYNANYVSGHVNSVNSGIFVGQRNIYGARFTSANFKILCDYSGC